MIIIIFDLVAYQNSRTVDLFGVVFNFHFVNSERRIPFSAKA